MAEYWVRLKTKLNLQEAVLPLRSYYSTGIAPLSRSHTLELTDAQVEIVKNLPNVAEVQPVTEYEYELYSTQTGRFNKDNRNNECAGNPTAPINRQPYECLNWALLDCTSEPSDDWGLNLGRDPNQSDYNYWLDGTADIFSNGRHVDIIITDTMVPYDHPELNWEQEEEPEFPPVPDQPSYCMYSPDPDFDMCPPGTYCWPDGVCRDELYTPPPAPSSRFVQYDWHQLTPYVRDVLHWSPQLNDTYTYANHAELKAVSPQDLSAPGASHGLHVATTAAGLRNGWAKEANVYSITLPFSDPRPSNQSTIGFADFFFYLRAFHLTKPINPETGRKNPTIVNCSWGYSNYSLKRKEWKWVTSIVHDGVTYSSSNPFPNGWNTDSFFWETGYGLTHAVQSWTNQRQGFIDDCIEDGIIIVGAAGNDNQATVNDDKNSWDDHINFTDNNGYTEKFFYRKNQWNHAITVGALGVSRHRTKAMFSNFGSSIDVFAPGECILASVARTLTPGGFPGATYLADNNYGKDSEGNAYSLYQMSGTSMAAPQVTGVIACHAGSTTKHRYTISDAKNYLNQTSNFNGINSYIDYYYNPMTHSNGLNSTNNLGSRKSLSREAKYGSPDRTGKDITGINNNRYEFDWYVFVVMQGISNQVGMSDIYGNSFNDMGGDKVFTLYEDGATDGTGDLYNFYTISLQDRESSYQAGDPLYATRPYKLINSDGTTVNSDIGIIEESKYQNGQAFQYKVKLGFAYGFIDYYGIDTVILTDVNTAGANSISDINITFKFIKPPDNVINYKHNNWTYLADSKTKTLVCESTRQDVNVLTPIEGERTSGYVYPRGARVYTQ